MLVRARVVLVNTPGGLGQGHVLRHAPGCMVLPRLSNSACSTVTVSVIHAAANFFTDQGAWLAAGRGAENS